MRAGLVNSVSAFAIAAFGAVGIAATAHAGSVSVLFTFDPVTINSITYQINPADPSAGNNTDISTYMTNVLSKTTGNAGWSVTSLTTGAYGAKSEQNYTGDSHVVGPTESYTGFTGQIANGTYQLEANHVIPLTLGNTDGIIEPGAA